MNNAPERWPLAEPRGRAGCQSSVLLPLVAKAPRESAGGDPVRKRRLWSLATPLAARGRDAPTRRAFVRAYFDLPAGIRLLAMTEWMDMDTRERWYEYTVLFPYPTQDDEWAANDRRRRLRLPWPVEGVAEQVYSRLAQGGPEAVMPFLKSEVPWVRRCALDVLARVG